MNRQIDTDLELANYFSRSIARAYREAVEFSQSVPRHALVRFRDVLDLMCERIAKDKDIEFPKTQLLDRVNELFGAGAITPAIRDACHQLRKFGNMGAHVESGTGEHENAMAFQQRHKERHQQLVASTQTARDLAITLMDFVYRQEDPTRVVSGACRDYKKVIVDTQDWKDILFGAVHSESPELKYEAGLWCEAEAERIRRGIQTVIAADATASQHTFLMRLAADFHRASHFIDANLDAMYRYASIVEQGYLDGDKKDEAIIMIADAATRGHGQACDHYAAILYEDRNEYEAAERYWLLAIQHDIARAYYCLWLFYTDGKACEPNWPKAMAYLQKGVEQDSPECLCTLGELCIEGTGVAKDKAKGKKLLEQAAAMGNERARRYLVLKVYGGEQGIAEALSDVGRKLESLVNPPKQKQPRNELCVCGSGQKFKRCCGKNTERRI